MNDLFPRFNPYLPVNALSINPVIVFGYTRAGRRCGILSDCFDHWDCLHVFTSRFLVKRCMTNSTTSWCLTTICQIASSLSTPQTGKARWETHTHKCKQRERERKKMILLISFFSFFPIMLSHFQYSSISVKCWAKIYQVLFSLQ